MKIIVDIENKTLKMLENERSIFKGEYGADKLTLLINKTLENEYPVITGLLSNGRKIGGYTTDDSYGTERIDGVTYTTANFTLSKECIAFIDRVLNIDMNLRPNADELMNDNWITGKYDIKETAILKGKDEFIQGKHYFFFKDYWKDKTKHRKCLSMVKVQNNLNRQRHIESFLEKMKHVHSSNRSNNNKQVECSNNVFKEKKVYVRKETFSKISNTVRRLLSLSISNFDKDTKGSDDIENDISSCHTPIKAENHHINYHI